MIDISSKSEGPAGELSNFVARPFVLDGVKCASMEGFLQGLKFENESEQEFICSRVGFDAEKRGRARTVAWKRGQTLWWRGIPFDRHGTEYPRLLRRAFEAMAAQNPGFTKALAATGREELRHTLGRDDPRETILTEAEFCAILTGLRSRLWPEG